MTRGFAKRQSPAFFVIPSAPYTWELTSLLMSSVQSGQVVWKPLPATLKRLVSQTEEGKGASKHRLTELYGALFVEIASLERESERAGGESEERTYC